MSKNNEAIRVSQEACDASNACLLQVCIGLMDAVPVHKNHPRRADFLPEDGEDDEDYGANEEGHTAPDFAARLVAVKKREAYASG
eukprot:CAMPEP_0170609872 /NCGR_PEP_ID=MMETSP0224-20130122/22353_1 /TAXON_ID=285029 /ORGANISM="Togula jolla, Strain CCCM 725" /LENGTH=84 /DNA_ID=CAMNT_0010935201 /DNA_START=179 /DNA_END=434 /DNA_ORIENTATION=-